MCGGGRGAWSISAPPTPPPAPGSSPRAPLPPGEGRSAPTFSRLLNPKPFRRDTAIILLCVLNSQPLFLTSQRKDVFSTICLRNTSLSSNFCLPTSERTVHVQKCVSPPLISAQGNLWARAGGRTAGRGTEGTVVQLHVFVPRPAGPLWTPQRSRGSTRPPGNGRAKCLFLSRCWEVTKHTHVYTHIHAQRPYNSPLVVSFYFFNSWKEVTSGFAEGCDDNAS